MSLDEILWHLRHPEASLSGQDVGAERYSHLTKAPPVVLPEAPAVEHEFGEDDEGLPVILSTKTSSLDEPLNEVAQAVLESRSVVKEQAVVLDEVVVLFDPVEIEVTIPEIVVEPQNDQPDTFVPLPVESFEDIAATVATILPEPSFEAKEAPASDSKPVAGVHGKRGPKQTYDVRNLKIDEEIVYDGPLSTARVLASLRKKNPWNKGKDFKARQNDNGVVVIYRVS